MKRAITIKYDREDCVLSYLQRAAIRAVLDKAHNGAPSSVKLHVSIGKYWVSLYVLVCMVVCIVELIGMY